MFFAIRGDVDAIFERNPTARGVVKTLFSLSGLARCFVLPDEPLVLATWSLFCRKTHLRCGHVFNGYRKTSWSKDWTEVLHVTVWVLFISKTTQIGDDVRLHHHGVALGGTTWKKIKRNPTFGSNLVIGSRSTILDPLKILDNTKGRGRCCGCEWHTGRFDWYGRIGQSGFQGCREKSVFKWIPNSCRSPPVEDPRQAYRTSETIWKRQSEKKGWGVMVFDFNP